MSQADELNALYAKYLDDSRFEHLKAPGIFFVPGDGPMSPELMVIGEAPGRLENARKTPFVGKAGAILGEILEQKVGIWPHEVFMTNVVKFWPNNKGATRSPEDSEVEASREYLLEEIELVNPKFVALCGKYALNAVFPECRNVHTWNGKLLKDKYIPLFHPAYAAYRPEKRPLVEKGFSYLRSYLSNVA